MTQEQIHSRLTNIESTLVEVRDLTIENNIDLRYHIKRTDELQEMISPMYKERLETLAVKKYKAERRRELLQKIKIPAAILSLIIAMYTVFSLLKGL